MTAGGECWRGSEPRRHLHVVVDSSMCVWYVVVVCFLVYSVRVLAQLVICACVHAAVRAATTASFLETNFLSFPSSPFGRFIPDARVCSFLVVIHHRIAADRSINTYTDSNVALCAAAVGTNCCTAEWRVSGGGICHSTPTHDAFFVGNAGDLHLLLDVCVCSGNRVICRFACFCLRH